MQKRITRLLFVLIIGALLLAACGGAPATATPAPVPNVPTGIVAEGRLMPRENLGLFFGARGKVAEILIAEGATVQSGDVLVRLADSAQAEAGLAAATLELTAAQQAYDALIRTADLSRAQAWKAYMDAQTARAAAERAWEAFDLDNLENRIDDAQASVKDAKAELEDAQTEFEKYKDLNEENARRKTAEDDLEKARKDYNEVVRVLESTQREEGLLRAALDSALAAEAESRRTYQNSANGPDADKLALAEARLENAKAQVAAAELAVDNFVIKAPFTGTIADINVKPGELVGPEKYAVLLANFNAWIVETTDLTELDVVEIAEGQSVTLLADALPGEEMTGTVEDISRVFRAQSGDILYTVTIALDTVPAAARWGMTMQVTFEPQE